LAATIKQHRKELIQDGRIKDDESMISATPPENIFIKHIKEIEDIGEPVHPCFFTNSHIDPTHWYSFLHLSLLSSCQSLVLFFSGGCLRNMMEFEDSGIP